MARRLTQYIEISGPLLEGHAARLLHDAVAEGMEEMGEEGASVLGAAVLQRGFVRSGRFLRSIEALAKRQSPNDSAGYVAVKFTDAYPEPGRPPVTWFERGTRKGVRLRTGGYGLRKSATALRAMDQDAIFVGRISEALNG